MEWVLVPVAAVVAVNGLIVWRIVMGEIRYRRAVRRRLRELGANLDASLRGG